MCSQLEWYWMEQSDHTYPNMTDEPHLGYAYKMCKVCIIWNNMPQTIAEQSNYWSLMERVGAENTDSIVVTVLKPLQVRLYHALSPKDTKN